MLKIKVNDRFSFEVTSEKDVSMVNGHAINADKVRINDRTFHILHKGRSYNAELLGISRDEKSCSVKVGNNIYSMQMTDQFDELLHQLGMDNLKVARVSEVKAPMPGLVIRILVAEGDEVEKGGNLFVLEAMKMENIIKAPADVKIKSIRVKSGDKVEKNQVMMIFA
ncbi:MAG TPA: acetyl-CoA carboxylase biotin carboxyl carrier protein subunit [Daejeonella sp.]|uniref:acetyl-CoA carboxylase biotin carboxyl carrier protein subunit n=1 Tax=Daejeonella sp. TaxID=2805397 RepID=UPI002EDA8CE0